MQQSLTLVLLTNIYIYTLCYAGVGKYPISSSKTPTENFNDYTHVFEVQLFNGVVDDITSGRLNRK